jgi:hypothetical protein
VIIGLSLANRRQRHERSDRARPVVVSPLANRPTSLPRPRASEARDPLPTPGRGRLMARGGRSVLLVLGGRRVVAQRDKMNQSGAGFASAASAISSARRRSRCAPPEPSRSPTAYLLSRFWRHQSPRPPSDPQGEGANRPRWSGAPSSETTHRCSSVPWVNAVSEVSGFPSPSIRARACLMVRSGWGEQKFNGDRFSLTSLITLATPVAAGSIKGSVSPRSDRAAAM